MAVRSIGSRKECQLRRYWGKWADGESFDAGSWRRFSEVTHKHLAMNLSTLSHVTRVSGSMVLEKDFTHKLNFISQSISPDLII